MGTSTGSHKRIPLSRHATYDAAYAARISESRYPPEQLQIRKHKSGTEFQLVARIPVNVKPVSKQEN